MNFRPRRTIAAAAASLALLGLAGCSGSDDDTTAPETGDTTSAAADETTSDAPSETETSESTDEGAGGDAGGLADVISKSFNEGKSAHVVMNLGDQGTGEGDMSFGSDSPAMDLTMTVAGQDAQMRLVDGVFYVKSSSFGDKWVKMDLADLGGQMSIPDPSELIKQLEGSEANATEVAPGHWQFDQDGTTTELFADDDGYISKVTTSVSGAGDITMTYSDWGKDVDIKAPAAGDVMEMPSMPGAS